VSSYYKTTKINSTKKSPWINIHGDFFVEAINLLLKQYGFELLHTVPAIDAFG